MLPFPIPYLTWRESVVGFQATEMVYMQVEKNWVAFMPPGYRSYGSGQAMGKNMGYVKWRMAEDPLRGRNCRMLHSEAYELKTGDLQVEEIWVDPATNEIVQQNEQLTTLKGTERAESTYFSDRVETRRTGSDGRTINATLYPEGGMAVVQRRFAPMTKEVKEFLLVDGVGGKLRKIKIEPAGRFRGTWGDAKYEGNSYRFTCEGKEHTAMVTPEGEIVQVAFGKDVTLALTNPTRSRRRVSQPKSP